MRSRILFPKPHSLKQEVICNSLITRGLTELWVPCGTKFGKSFAAGVAISSSAMIRQGALCRWVAPIYSQTKIGFKYCRKFLPPHPHTHPNNSDLALTIKGLDSTIEFKSGKYPEDLEGEAVHGGYILDECSKMSEQVYNSAKTTVTVTRAPIVAISTPRGKNWFYSKCMAAKEEMEWCLARGLPPSKMFITAPSSANPLVSAEAIEEARKSLPDRLFRQYYLAEFVDDGSVFVGYQDCLDGPELQVDPSHMKWISPQYTGGTVVIGADWAKTVDYTVFTAFDITTGRLVGFERFHKTPYTAAIRRLVLFSHKFKDVIVVRHDKTGLGQAIDDQLAYTDLPYEGVTFTNQWKTEAVAQLITSIEHRQIILPRWSELIDEFESYEVSTSSVGTMTYSAVDGKHDDIISSLLLSHSALLQYGETGADINFLDDTGKKPDQSDTGSTQRKDDLHPIERFYREIADDDDD